MNENTGHLEHDDIERLLPWFANGTLDQDERDRVSEHVRGCKICEQAITELSMIRANVQTHPVTPIVPEPNVDGLMAALDAQEARGPAGVSQWAVAASVGALLLVAFAFMYYSDDGLSPVPQRYETAISAQDAPQIDYVLTVSFVDGLGSARREEILESFGSTDVSPAGPEGVYRVTVPIPATSMQELDRFTDKLRGTAGVESVEVVALQLPVSREP